MIVVSPVTSVCCSTTHLLAKGNTLYWSEGLTNGNASVKRVSITGGAPTTLISGLDLNAFAQIIVDEAALYLNNAQPSGVTRYDLQTLARSTVAIVNDNQGAFLVADALNFYAITTSASAIWRIPK